MNLITRMSMMKKEICVTEIPKDLLEFKSDAKIFGNVLYYLNKGIKMLSILENPTRQLEVLNKLNSLNQYFNINYNNLYIEKGTDKLLGFVYPFESKFSSKDCVKSKDLDYITDNEKVKAIFGEINSNLDKSSKNVLRHILFLYEVLKYLNTNGISVKNLEVNSIKKYQETYNERYLDIMNSISMLDILDEGDSEDEIIIEICMSYLEEISHENSFVENLFSKLDGIVKDFKSNSQVCDFENILVEQIESLVVCNSCKSEYDKSYMRCPICHQYDRFVTIDEIDGLKNEKEINVLNDDFKFYHNDESIEFILKDYETKSLSSEKLKTIIDYMDLVKDDDVNYGILYNSKAEIFGFDIIVQTFNVYTLREYFDKIIDNLEYKGNIEIFSKILHSSFDELESLHCNNFRLDYSKNVIDKLLVLELKYGSLSIFTNPTEVIYDVGIDSMDESKIICDMFFSYCKEKFGSSIDDNGKIVSKKFDIIRLFYYNLVEEYKKFLKGENYESSVIKDFFHREYEESNYDSSYIISPELCDILLYDDIGKYQDDYEFVKFDSSTKIIFNKINISEFLSNFKKIPSNISVEVLAPEYIVYRRSSYNSLKYMGYLIKKKKGDSLKKVFEEDLYHYSNKTILAKLITFIETCYKLYDEGGRTWYRAIALSKYLHYEADSSTIGDFSPMFVKYVDDGASIVADEYLERLVKNMKDIYLADATKYLKSVSMINIRNLKKTYDSLENYCDTHKIFYEKGLKKCPICEKYNIYIDIKKITSKKVISSNNFYDLVAYNKDYYIKLFKAKEGKFENGMSLSHLEQKVISMIKIDDSMYKKVVKEYTTEEPIGILVYKKVYKNSLYDLMEKEEDVTNKSFLNFAILLINKYKKNEANMQKIFEFFAKNKYDVKDCIQKNIFVYKKQIKLIDYEFIYSDDKNLNETGLHYLDRLIKYILSYDIKCLEFESIVYPEVDGNYLDELLDKLLELRNYISKSDSFCKKHGVYYNQEDGGCPLCIEEMDEIVLKPENTYLIPKADPISRGAEAMVYNLGLRKLLKMYTRRKPDENCSKKAELEKALVEDFQQAMKRREAIIDILLKVRKVTENDLKDKNFMIVFPEKSLYATDKRIFKGFVQEKVKSPVSLALLLNVETCNKLGLTTIDSILKILIYYGESIEYMHNSPLIRSIVPEGIIVGDVSGRNALYSKCDKKVALIDTDSVGTKDYPCCMYTAQFADPENVIENKNSSFESDWYSYAILCFFALTRIHPFGGTYIAEPSMEIQERMKKKVSIIGSKSDFIKIPKDLVVNWDWMPKELKNAFLDIFERNYRYSILNYLKMAYNVLTNTEEYVIPSFSNPTSEEVVANYNDSVSVNKEVTQDKAEEVISTQTSKESKLNIMELYKKGNDMSLELFLNDNKIICFHDKNNDIRVCRENLDTSIGYLKVAYKANYLEVENSYLVARSYGIAIGVLTFENKKYIATIKDGDYKLIYKMSDKSRTFGIFYDYQNDMYLLLSHDNSKSYIVKGEKVISYEKIYKKIDFNTNKKLLSLLEKCSFNRDKIFYPEDGYIVRYDMKSGEEKRVYVSDTLVTNDSTIRLFSNGFIVVNKEGVYKVFS